ncbi:glycosyltransferase family 2 protein [Phenylobacterium soli]|uniref:Glycosyl transferase family A n=1 Tax=Phenylobacterium soli TaxID=2170551 RepID=A0A328ALV2_9CAUL|nr:glycosyltransferase family 2 protein [Phenylobacterium soli]RAK55830.1 glycosyl transferase family A [Phenylobacterium soli]
MAQNDADVGVIIAAYNAERTIARAIASALAEPEACEVIVVVDGATDATAQAARAADDGSGRLQVIELALSGGPAAARNLAISKSRAAWVCPLDSDDFFLPGRLGRLRAETGYCDFVADDLLRVIEGRLDAPPHPMIGERMKLPMCLDLETFARANISRPHLPRAELGFLKPLMRRSFLTSHHLVYDESLRLGEDFILYAKALAIGARFKVIGPCGYMAVERADSISGSHGAAELRSLVDASRRLERFRLTPDELAAVREHRAHVAAKLALREFLDAKRAAGLVGAAAVLARAPSAAPYVVTTIAADVLRRRRSAKPAEPARAAAA